MIKIITLAILSLALCSQSVNARERSQKAKDSFKYSHPCPSSGNNHGSCPGYIIDHITALACGGADDPSNMQWQTKEASKTKDRWERKDCQIKRPANRPYSGSGTGSLSGEYHTGKRGGCFTYSASGKKRYVSHSFCGR
jgi:hypothetical protein